MVKTIKLSTLNVRGLGQDLKRKTLAGWLNDNHQGILFIQETHSSIHSVDKWENEFNCKIYCSHGSTKSQGVAILIPKGTPHKVNHMITDQEGRYIILDVTIYEETMILVSTYFPTKDKENLQIKTLENLTTEMVQYFDKNIILAGDLNIAINPFLDKPKGKTCSNESKQFRVKTLAFLEAFNLNDPLRIKYPGKKLSTWHTKLASTRLDYIMVSNPLLNRITKCKITPAILTDHDLVQINFTITENVERGPGYWKFNSVYLNNKDYVNLIKLTVKKSLKYYANVEDKGLLWDMVKMSIRASSIKFAREFNSKQKRIEKELQIALDKLKEALIENPTDAETETAIAELLKELEQFATLKAKGAMLRAKTQWNEEGEKNTAYFLSLEKRNAEDKCIHFLKESEDVYIMERKAVNDKIFNFYKNLYSENKVNDSVRDNSFLEEEFKKLSQPESELCEGIVTYDEALKALKGMKNKKKQVQMV